MNLLWTGLLIQIVFYILYDAYIPIILFIVLALATQLFSKNIYVYLLIPMICAHVVYEYLKQSNRIKERESFNAFKKLRGRFNQDQQRAASLMNSVTSYQQQLNAQRQANGVLNSQLANLNKRLAEATASYENQKRNVNTIATETLYGKKTAPADDGIEPAPSAEAAQADQAQCAARASANTSSSSSSPSKKKKKFKWF